MPDASTDASRALTDLCASAKKAANLTGSIVLVSARSNWSIVKLDESCQRPFSIEYNGSNENDPLSIVDCRVRFPSESSESSESCESRESYELSV